MSKKTPIPEYMREMLAAFEMLRRLGFNAGDIYCVRYKNVVAMELHTQGKEFVIVCGKAPDMSDEKFGQLWKRAALMWNGERPGMSLAERQRVFHGSRMLNEGGFVSLVARLMERGFVVPFVQTGNGADPSVLVNVEMKVNSAGGQA